MANKIFAAYNRTKDIPIADNTLLASSLFKRMRGLMGSSVKGFVPGQGLWIVPCEGIQTFGMRFPIDAAYLDAAGRVLRVYHRLSPWRIAAVNFRTHSVLELPPGTLARTQTQVGDVIELSAVRVNTSAPDLGSDKKQ